MFDKFKQIGELKKMRDEALRIQRELAAEKIEIEEDDIKIVVSGDQKIVTAANKEITQNLIFCGKYNKAKIISNPIPCLIGPVDGGRPLMS